MSQVIHVPPERLLMDTTRPNWLEIQKKAGLKVELVPASKPPIYTGSHFLTNIGRDPYKPVLLDLRFAPIDSINNISLLMTDQRTPRVLDGMASELVRLLKGFEFDAIIAPQSLGPLLSTSVARLIDPDIPCAAVMKGKPMFVDGESTIGAPKQWINPNIYVEFRSGTSHEGTVQRFYMDDTYIFNWESFKVVLVDDARLSEETIRASLQIASKHGLEIVGIATVLNEHGITDSINGIPYVSLTTLPLSEKTSKGYAPIQGTYGGLDFFYKEVR